jgi:signal transduction histidine kinase
MLRAAVAPTLAGSLLLVTALLFWFGYRATREWERSNLESVRTRGNEVLELLGVALERDMKGALTTVLLPFNVTILQASSRYDLADRFAGAFARFPYLESFFVWRATSRTSPYFFNRAEQPPSWDRSNDDDDIYPVLIRRDPAAVRHVVESSLREASRGVRFAAFEATVENVRYQTLVHLIYGGRQDDEVTALVGFMVNLDRVRRHYFLDFIQHVQDVTGDRSLAIEVIDERGRLVARTGPPSPGTALGHKTFPLLFADPALLAYLSSDERGIPWWSAAVNIAGESSILAAERATARTLMVLGLAALATMAALAWTVRAARAAAALATAQAEFVSAMSHEMKTPLSLITLASDTLANGRYTSPATITDYGHMLTREAHHLRRLIDNVLCYARLHTANDPHSFEELDVSELIEDAVERFRPYLAELELDVRVQVPLDTLSIIGDRVMMLHVLDNLIDNAAKHGSGGRRLTVKAALDGAHVRVEVIDAGKGIAPEELTRIFDKFYRGKGIRTRGTGLGLAIVQRIVSDHGGTVSVDSRIGEGTTVIVVLPVMARAGPVVRATSAATSTSSRDRARP